MMLSGMLITEKTGTHPRVGLRFTDTWCTPRDGFRKDIQVGNRDGGSGLLNLPTDFSWNELGFAVMSKSYKCGWLSEQMPSFFTSLLKL